jgi:divalent metal cation (Fe/Co/Zn/Cd) transporter
MKYHIDLHARVDGSISVEEGHTLAHKLKDKLKEMIPTLGNVLIHIEPQEKSEIEKQILH